MGFPFFSTRTTTCLSVAHPKTSDCSVGQQSQNTPPSPSPPLQKLSLFQRPQHNTPSSSSVFPRLNPPTHYKFDKGAHTIMCSRSPPTTPPKPNSSNHLPRVHFWEADLLDQKNLVFPFFSCNFST